MHLGNLPDDGYRELEAVCVGLRFGKVDHYVVLKNKNKVSIFFPMVQSTLLGKKKPLKKKIFFSSPSTKNVLLMRDQSF